MTITNAVDEMFNQLIGAITSDTKPPTYRPRPIKRARRTKAGMDRIRGAIHRVAAADAPVTCRQVFYRLVSEGVIAKQEKEYKTVVRLLGEMRRAEQIPFNWIADNTRWMRKPQTFSSAEAALRNTAKFYRRSVWDNQDCYVEIWLEKDSLAGVIVNVTAEWDVPLMVTRGYPSLSFLYEAAEYVDGLEKPVYLYYFGDWDPSGVDIDRTIEKGITEFAVNAEIYFERVAITPAQIAAYNLPTRPTKASDTRSRSFRGESVEVDAIPPDMLREMVMECITKHVDRYALKSLQVAEQSERELLLKIASGQNGSDGVGVGL